MFGCADSSMNCSGRESPVSNLGVAQSAVGCRRGRHDGLHRHPEFASLARA